MSTVELRVALHPPRELWTKPDVPPDARGALVGWVEDLPRVENAVPEDVARILARALTSHYTLTFIDPGVESAPEWRDRGDHWTRFLKPTGMLPFVPKAGYALTSTASPEVAMRLFATEESLWSLQSQMVLLTQPGSSPPALSFQALHDLMQSRRLDQPKLEMEWDCQGIMTPGPDGDFAQIILWRPGALEVFKETLRLQSEELGIRFAELSEAEFKETRWFSREAQG